MSTNTPYSTDTQTVVLIERERAQTTALNVYRSGSKLIPTNAIYSLLNSNGKKIIDAVTANIAGDGECSYTYTIDNTNDFSEGYVEEWTITLSDGTTPIFRRTAAVVRRRLYPVVSTQDLSNYYHSINDLLPIGLTSWQKYIDTAWSTIIRRVRSRSGSFPYLVMSPESFFEAHIHLSLSRIFEDLHASVGTTQSHFFEMSQSHYQKFIDEFNALNFVYDESNDGKPDDKDKRTAARSMITMNKPPYYGIRRGRTW